MTSEDLLVEAPFNSGDLRASAETHTPKGINDLPDELLVDILSHVSLQQRFQTRRVSQRWSRIVSDIGYHIDPLFLNDRDDTPFYSAEIPIQLNPMLRRSNNIHGQYQRFCCRISSREEFLQGRSEFITTPPISVLNLRVYMEVPTHAGRVKTQTVRTTLRTATPVSSRPEGIRVSDLIDTVTKISTYAERMHWDWEEAAWYATDSDEGRWKVIQPAQGKSKIEVRRDVRP